MTITTTDVFLKEAEKVLSKGKVLIIEHYSISRHKLVTIESPPIPWREGSDPIQIHKPEYTETITEIKDINELKLIIKNGLPYLSQVSKKNPSHKRLFMFFDISKELPDHLIKKMYLTP